jgi:neurofibromin 1
LANHLQTESVSRFPDSKYHSLAALIFLRFFCPVILAPDIIPGLLTTAQMSEIEKKRRPLILISTILQNIANGIEFTSKENYMQDLNPLIQQNIKPTQEFFDKLVVCSLSTSLLSHSSIMHSTSNHFETKIFAIVVCVSERGVFLRYYIISIGVGSSHQCAEL